MDIFLIYVTGLRVQLPVVAKKSCDIKTKTFVKFGLYVKSKNRFFAVVIIQLMIMNTLMYLILLFF